MDVIFGLLSLFLVFFLVIKNLNKYFVPTPAEGRERERVNPSHFQWVLSVPGGGGSGWVKLRFQQQAQKIWHAAILETILSMHSKLTEKQQKLLNNIAVCSLIFFIIYLLTFASNCLSRHIINQKFKRVQQNTTAESTCTT